MNELIISHSNKIHRIDPFIIDKLNEYGPGILDARHHGFTKEQKYKIMCMKYQDEFIADALETGHFIQTNNGEIKVALKTLNQDISVIAGYIFEALTVRLANDDEGRFGHEIFKWCTMRKRLSEQFFEKFQAIGTGFLKSKKMYPGYYNSSHRQFDMIFLTMNPKENKAEPATIVGTSIPVGIQVKAITSNEMEDIIKPLLTEQYDKVITYLRHSSGEHSYEVCMKIIKRLSKEGKITEEDKYSLDDRIGHPEMFGLDQRDIDDYYDFIKEWHKGRIKEDNHILKAVGIQAQEIRNGNSFITVI